MARPPSGTDIKLIAAGKKLVCAKGLTGLSVREACRLAKVNTGMFHYHFRTKDEFAKRIIKDIYGEFFVKFQGGIASGSAPREKLKNALMALAKFARDARKVVPVLLADIIYGRKEVFSFVKGNFTGHIALIIELVGECQRDGTIRKLPVPFVLSVLVPPMIFSSILLSVFEKHGVNSVLDIPLEKARDMALSDAAIEERAEIILKSLA